MGHATTTPPQGAEGDRHARGRRAYLSGLAAEASAERHYLALGYRLLARRWRCPAGELDLVFEGANGLVAVEVKLSRTIEGAIASLRPRQVQRVALAAQLFCDDAYPGQIVELRVDLFAVSRDGRFEVIENITAG